MKKKEILFSLSEAEYQTLKILARQIKIKYEFEPTLQEIGQALWQLSLTGEPEGGFESRKGRFWLEGIIRDLSSVWTDKKKIEKEYLTALNNEDLDNLILEYEALHEKNKKGLLNKKEKMRLGILREKGKEILKKSGEEEARIREDERKGKYRGPRRYREKSQK